MAKGNREWKHQVRTVLEAARLENEPLVVLNLLRYQAARNPGNWRDPEDVYEALTTALDGCREKAASDAALAMALIRHLLAYTYRAFTFHEAELRRGDGSLELLVARAGCARGDEIDRRARRPRKKSSGRRNTPALRLRTGAIS